MDPETGRIKVIWELVAGGMAGGCQVVRRSLNLCPCSILKVFCEPDFHESFGNCVSDRLFKNYHSSTDRRFYTQKNSAADSRRSRKSGRCHPQRSHPHHPTARHSRTVQGRLCLFTSRHSIFSNLFHNIFTS